MYYQPESQFRGQVIKTKKYALDSKKYISIAMKHLLRTQWYWAAVPAGLIIINIILNLTVYPSYWIYIIPILVVIGYLAFWAIQFTGVSQLEQYKVMFQKMHYEIDTRQVLAKLNQREGMQLKWDMIKSAYKEKDHFLLVLSRAQFLYWPFEIFASDNDLRATESILRRKNLIKDKVQKPA
jgi:hypothetical protein